MLTEYDHYLLSFHDQFIEAIAHGIWFERSDRPIEGAPLAPDHPLVTLPESTVAERLEVDGITCQIRTNPKPMDELLRDARYCSQPLYGAGLELDGEARPNHRLSVRFRHGEVRSIWRGTFGPRVVIPGIATIGQVKALIAPYMRDVAERRRQRRQ